MTYVLLARHGQNEWVQKKRLAGWIPDIHLNDEGRQQAQALAQRLAHLPIRSIYSSPVTRCLETANAVASVLGLPVEERPAFGEVRYGEWEGEKIEKLAKEKAWYAVQHFPSRFRFPQGEALRHVQSRAVDALEELHQQHEKDDMVVVVSHADLIKLLLAYYLGVHVDLFQRIVISPASVSVLALHENGPVRVVRINDDGPLQPPPERSDEGDEQETNGEEREDDGASPGT